MFKKARTRITQNYRAHFVYYLNNLSEVANILTFTFQFIVRKTFCLHRLFHILTMVLTFSNKAKQVFHSSWFINFITFSFKLRKVSITHLAEYLFLLFSSFSRSWGKVLATCFCYSGTWSRSKRYGRCANSCILIETLSGFLSSKPTSDDSFTELQVFKKKIIFEIFKIPLIH